MSETSKNSAVCPGSFDPVTRGHQYIFDVAAARFSELVVTVMVNPNKKGLFTIDERVAQLTAVTAHLPNVRIATWEGLLVDFARHEGIGTIIKGLRNSVDFEYEIPMAQMNRDLTGVETFFMLTEPTLAHVSSSLIKEVAKLGGDITDFVAPEIKTALLNKLAE